MAKYAPILLLFCIIGLGSCTHDIHGWLEQHKGGKSKGGHGGGGGNNEGWGSQQQYQPQPQYHQPQYQQPQPQPHYEPQYPQGGHDNYQEGGTTIDIGRLLQQLPKAINIVIRLIGGGQGGQQQGGGHQQFGGQQQQGGHPQYGGHPGSGGNGWRRK